MSVLTVLMVTLRKGVNFMACELYLNKAVIAWKKKKKSSERQTIKDKRQKRCETGSAQQTQHLVAKQFQRESRTSRSEKLFFFKINARLFLRKKRSPHTSGLLLTGTKEDPFQDTSSRTFTKEVK